MKKILIISFLIFTILLSFFSKSYAAVAVTGDKIFDFFKKLESSNLTIKQVGEGISSNATMGFEGFKITNKDNKIIFAAPNDSHANLNFELNYSITDKKVSFHTTRTYNVNDIENTEEAMKEVTVLMLLNFTSSCAFLSIADIQGTDLSVAYAYFSKKLQTADEKENKKEVTDDVFYYLQTTTDNSFSYNLEIDLDNWSKVNSVDSTGYTVAFTPISTSSTNKKDNNITNTSTSLQESVNKVTNSTSKLPQTGNFFNVKDALLFLILACAAGIVFLMIPNVKYRNIK